MSIPDRLGDFRIVEEIGRGGFGVVYRAEQVSLDRPVALKVLYQHRVHTADEVARFEREARAAAKLDHGGIVSVYAWGQDGGDFFIAQKLVGEGLTVADQLSVIKEQGEPPKGYFRRAARWLAVVAEALQHAHERGIVHRDVKPSNILLDEQDRPYLGDFGLAKVEDGLELSRTGDFAGSPFYMSPEQADSRRGQVDHRSDIYALGVTLYELLTLKPPFEGQSSHEIIRKILTEDPKRPTKLNPRVPMDLETIALKAMEKGRVHRYQSAEAFAHDLRCYLDGEPISAAPPSTMSRIVRTARRHQTKVGMAALSAVVLVLAYVAYDSIKEGSESHRQAEQAEMTQQARESAREQLAVLENVAGPNTELIPTEEEIDAALEQNDAARARALRERRREMSDMIEKGSDLLVGMLPDITDSKALQDIGAAMKDQFLLGGMQEAQRILEERRQQEEQQDDGGAIDQQLKEVNTWLDGFAAQLQGLDLDELGIVTPGVDAQGEIAAEGAPADDDPEVATSGDAEAPAAPATADGEPAEDPAPDDGALPLRDDSESEAAQAGSDGDAETDEDGVSADGRTLRLPGSHPGA